MFADPPFNIGYEYDSLNDKRSCDDYLKWCQEWISQVSRVLKRSGSFWLAIGDEYAAELAVLCKRGQRIDDPARRGMMRLTNWVIWYYTFGVSCQVKFARSHTHLLHFTASSTPALYPDCVRVPSERQRVYEDKRANPKGKLPDNTWILSPSQVPDAFRRAESVWHVPRVAGTFKQRANITTNQMPEQILARIMYYSTKEGDLVVDPFSGSGTTGAVAKKLGRNFIGMELSKNYAIASQKRIDAARKGDVIDG